MAIVRTLIARESGRAASGYGDSSCAAAGRAGKWNAEIVNVAKVEVYTTSYCPFCTRAKALLDRKGIKFDEIDVTDDPAMRQKMVVRAGGRRTVPEIFINDRIVGGYDELRALDLEGELDALLAHAS